MTITTLKLQDNVFISSYTIIYCGDCGSSLRHFITSSSKLNKQLNIKQWLNILLLLIIINNIIISIIVIVIIIVVVVVVVVVVIIIITGSVTYINAQ